MNFLPLFLIRSELSVRKELNIPDDALIIGLAARYDPQKIIKILLKLLLFLRDYILRAQQEIYLCCGEGVTWENREIVEPIEKQASGSGFTFWGEGMIYPASQRRWI